MDKEIKILILEDNANDIELIQHELEKSKMAFVCKIVSGEKEFERELRSYKPAIVLSDYSLPSFNAEDAFTLKERINPEIPFIIVSGMIDDEKAVELIKNGVTDYVMKDKLFKLPGKIERALQESKAKTDKSLTEERLIESQNRLAEAQMIAKIGNWEVDLLTGEQTWCNEIHNILGIKPGELIPSMENFLSFVHPERRREIEQKIVVANTTYKPFSYTTKIIRKDNSIRYVYSNGKTIFNRDGDPIRQIGILQDITDTKKMEEDLKAMNKELETFIYRASHDLRGPLSSIIGLTNVSKSEIKDETSKKYFQMVEASAQKLDATLISLVQSMTMRDMVVDLQEVDLDELINDTLTQLKYHDGFSKIKIEVHNSLKAKLLSNKLILASVFQNLIQNAIKYQNYHNGQARLDIFINKKENGVELIFDDNGIGVDDHLQDKIFDMYFRGTSSASGSGLGLYIVKIGIEKLKGNIRFTSSKDNGAKFIITLPDVKLIHS
jgi:PAS domain S-box-containing protein